MKNILLMGALLTAVCFGQGTTSKIHGAGSLPTACVSATTTQSGDVLIVSGVLYVCTAGGNPGTWTKTALLIGSGAQALNTNVIASGACDSVVSVTAANVLTTDNVLADFNADPTGTTGYVPGAMLTIIKYPTAGHVNFKVCNNTASSITPAAVTLNWRVMR